MRDFAGAQTWMSEYRRQFDQSIQGLAPEEVLRLLPAAIDSIRAAHYAALVARSHIALELADITRTAAYLKIETRHAWELQG
jgi:hypothetical protein